MRPAIIHLHPLFRMISDPALAAACPAAAQQAWLDAKAARGQPVEGDRLQRLEPLARAARAALPAMHDPVPLWLRQEWCVRGGTAPADHRDPAALARIARRNRLAQIMGRIGR